MSTHNDAAVVIVGAGPTGVMLAIELARRGVEVSVLDKQPERPQESRAIGIHARTLEIFHQIGIVDEFLELGHRVHGMAFHTTVRRGLTVRFGGLDSPYPFLLTLSQEVTQRILDEQLERLGVAIERGAEVIDLDPGTGGVGLRVRTIGAGSERVVRAGWLVGCDGVNSLVRRGLGASFDGDDYAQDWLMAEVNIDWPYRNDFAHIFARTASPLPAFPLPSGRWRLFVPEVPNRGGQRRPPDMAEIERLAAARGPGGMSLTDPSLLAAFRCYRRSTRIMRRGRMFLAGDAAHVHSPAGGQGLNTGLQDAFNLGWKLALVARGESPASLLDTYQAERAPIAAGVLALSHGLVRTFAMPSPIKRRVRDRLLPAVTAKPAVEGRWATRLAQLSHSYRGGPLAVSPPGSADGSITSGDRLPNVIGADLDGRTVCSLDLLGSTGHTLFVVAADVAQARDATTSAARSEVEVKALVLDGRTDRRHRRLLGRLVLVRPDGYVACVAPQHRPDIPERYMHNLCSAH
jgi:2-polyprenyl-6-methoxyphenol hydroxylase-like FAD-dependent oxidoreductase